MNPYQVLGVQVTDDDATIQNAFKKLCKDNHPDKGGSEARMAELNEAYALIGNPEKRKEYDRNHSWINEFNLYASVLGHPTVAKNFGKKPVSRTAVNGADINLKVNIPFSVFVNGCPVMPVQFERRTACLECDGTGATRAARCGNCAGIGKVKDAKTHRFRKCPKCDGTGIIIVEKCPYCDGGENKKTVAHRLVYVPGMLSTKVTGKGDSGHFGGCNGNLVVTFNPELPENCRIVDGKLVVDGPEIYPEDLVMGKWVTVKCGDEDIRIHIQPNSTSSVIDAMTGSGLKLRVNFKIAQCRDEAELQMYLALRELHDRLKT